MLPMIDFNIVFCFKCKFEAILWRKKPLSIIIMGHKQFEPEVTFPRKVMGKIVLVLFPTDEYYTSRKRRHIAGAHITQKLYQIKGYDNIVYYNVTTKAPLKAEACKNSFANKLLTIMVLYTSLKYHMKQHMQNQFYCS